MEIAASGRPATIRGTAGLFEVAAQIRRGGVRRLVVVDASGHVLGIVAMDDLIPVLAEELWVLSLAIRAKQRRDTRLHRIRGQAAFFLTIVNSTSTIVFTLNCKP